MVGTVYGERAHFCCYGCLLALQVTRASGDTGAATSILVRLGLAIFFTMNVMMVSMPTYVPYVYGDAAGATDGPLFQVLRVLAMIFAAPVMALLGWPVWASAVRGVRIGRANTDALIILGTAAAYALSVANTLRGHGAVYFDTAAMLLVLVTLGRYLEAKAKAEAGAAVRAVLAPAPAVAARLRNGRPEPVSPDVLVPEDIVRVGPGDAFPTDGTVLDGTGNVDEAALTGESRATVKCPGSTVASGTCSVDGVFLVRVTAAAAASAAARIARLLVDARRQRAPAERLADRVSAVLVPCVLVVAALTGVLWAHRAGAAQGILTSLAVLVVACPCGLGIATPVAVWTGLVVAARRGVIVRSAARLEHAADIGRVLFDKTGTLTERSARLVAVEPASDAGISAHELLARAAALEDGLTHPLARGIAAACDVHDQRRGASAVRVVPGRGVRGLIEGEPTMLGSVQFAREDLGSILVSTSAGTDDEGSVVLVWTPGRLLGALRFAEALRPEATSAVHGLEQLGVRVGLLSGDKAAGVLVPAIIPAADAALNLLPEDKVAHVRALRTTLGTNPRRKAIAMVGDGINDAPALAAADIGIAVADATDLARITADVVIINDDLQSVPWLIAYARRVGRVIRQNLFWVFAYNAVAIALAAAGTLTPVVASVAMLASSLAVVTNARRLRRP